MFRKIFLLLIILTSNDLYCKPINGSISIRGSIVAALCTLDVKQSGVGSRCYQNTKWIKKTSSLESLAHKSVLLPDNQGKSRLEWVNQAKTTGVLKVEYF